jgi:endogenous inhibitor of DNA gyrase (YacG/DUF329 family)
MRKILCETCGKEFFYQNSKRRFCSRICFINANLSWNRGKKLHYTIWNKGTIGKSKPNKTSYKNNDPRITGENNHQWKNGKQKTANGYIKVRTGKTDKGTIKYGAMEHRIIMEKHLGRKLSRNELVHHKNGIKDDNRIENLEIVLRKIHMGKITCPFCQKYFYAR